MSKMILFVCATGVATSTAVAEKVMEYCKDNGLDVNYSQTNVASCQTIPMVQLWLYQQRKFLMNWIFRLLVACQSLPE